mmetsp:Transcript_23811/g.38242  ORF Transcript_23811/g.38242 Transcript_23811/m.38242 type:complete len:524 (+) Transcript_23811:98-1669(+)
MENDNVNISITAAGENKGTSDVVERTHPVPPPLPIAQQENGNAEDSSDPSVPSVKTYSKNLWDKFNVVLERLTQGRRELKKANSFFETLASVEMQYSRGLAKVASIAKDFKSETSLHKCFTQALIFMNGWSSLHETTCTDLNTHVNAKISSMADEIKETVLKMQHHHASITKELKDLESSYVRRRARYVEAVQKSSDSHQAYQDARMEGKAQNQLQKLSTQIEKCKKIEATLYEKFQVGVLKLQNQQNTVVSETARMLQELEDLDNKRERTFKENMEFYLKLIKDIVAFETRGVEIQQRAHKEINIERDIQQFIAAHESHEKPKETITMEKALEGIQSENRTSQDSLRIDDPTHDGGGGLSSRNESHAESYSEGEMMQVVNLQAANLSDRIAVALGDFLPECKDGFYFRAGDEFDIVDAPEDGEWWTGKHKGKQGVFPAGLVRLQNVSHGFDSYDQEYKVIHAFEKENDDELTLNKGDVVHVTLVHGKWAIGKLVRRYNISEDGTQVGLFPLDILNRFPENMN